MKKQNNKKTGFISRLGKSRSLKSCKGIRRLLKTIAYNLYNEVAYVTIGVRYVDYWKKDDFFLKLFDEIKSQTLLNPNKMFSLYQFAKCTVHLIGDVAELGVYKGGSAKILSKMFEKHNPGKKILLFDTFKGLPPGDDKYDIHKEGDFGDITFDEVEAFLQDCNNVEFHKGLFSETLPKVPNKNFSFIHVDADIYTSVKECCEFFYPKMVRGGIIIFDDYSFICCPGVKKAVDEYFSDKPDNPVHLFTGQGLVIKQS